MNHAWPASEHAGVRGFGRGVVAGREAFWPTRDRVYVFDVASGQQTRAPIDLSPYTTVGANLVAADGRLLIVGHDRMMVLGPPRANKSAPDDTEDVQTVALSRKRPPSGADKGTGTFCCEDSAK